MGSRTLDLPAAEWRIGDLVTVSVEYGMAMVTLHRLEGAPGRVVVEFAGLPGHRSYPPTTMATVHRPAPRPELAASRGAA